MQRFVPYSAFILGTLVHAGCDMHRYGTVNGHPSYERIFPVGPMSFTLEEEIFTRDSLDMYLNVTIPAGWSLAKPIVHVTSLDDVLRDYKMERDAFQRDSLNYYHGTRKNRSIAIYLRFKRHLPSYQLRCIINLRDSTNALYAVDELLDVGWSEYSLRSPPSDLK